MKGDTRVSSYVSFVMSACDRPTIRRFERVLKKAGIACEYSEFRPAIPEVRATFSVVVRTDPSKAEHMRGRLTMVRSGVPGGEGVDIFECEIAHRR